MKTAHLLCAILAVLCGAPSLAAVRVARVKAPIHSVSAAYVERVLAEADAAADALVVIELDTPGGLGTNMKEMIQKIIASRTPVCVYVSPSGAGAASAGFLILLSADVAAMSPATNTGSAHPIFTGNEVIEEGKRHIMMEKVENDAAAFARSLAENRGRNVELSEKAVRDSLNFTEQEALKEGLIDLIAVDLAELLRELDGTTVRRFDGGETVLQVAHLAVIRTEMTGRERFLLALASPSLAFVLLALGAAGIYFEATHPGLIFPGVVGAISLLLFGFSSQILPINWIGLLFLAAGLVLFVLEVKVTSFGALTLGGVICLFLGGLMLYDTPDIPEMRIPPALLAAVSLALGGLVATLLAVAMRAHRSRVATGEEGLVGEIGTALTDLGLSGRVFVHGEYWDAVADVPLNEGEQIRVVRVDGMLLQVERVV